MLEWNAKEECGPFFEEIQEKARDFITLLYNNDVREKDDIL